jgi:nicotinamide-nucleotide amidase
MSGQNGKEGLVSQIPCVEVIVVGDEILSGTVIDTNSALIAEKLLDVGLEVRRMTAIGDAPEGIRQELRAAAGRSQLVIVTGGLGPTEDDRTAQAAAEAFGRPLVLDTVSLERIRAFFQRLGFEMNPSNEKQAYLPRGARAVPNPLGTAPGFAVEEAGCLLIFLPGVPRELERMMEESVLPMVRERFGDVHVVRSLTLKIFGLTESRMGEEVAGALEGIPGVSLASLPRYPENRLRVTARAPSEEEAQRLLDEAERRLRRRVGSWIYGKGEDELESVVVRLLTERGRTLATAESCTGGLIAHRLTDVSGCSRVLKQGLVVYSVESKRECLGVPDSLLKEPGPVSREVAGWMADRVRKLAGADLGLASTGVAGPTGGTEKTPVGTVFLGLADDHKNWSLHVKLRGGRTNVKKLAAAVALDWLRRYLLGEDPEAYTPWRR